MDIKHVTQGLDKTVPKLRYAVRNKPIHFSNPAGRMGKLKFMGGIVTALFKYERIEVNMNRAIEARGYAERLLIEAIRNGDCHQRTMEFADFYIEEKQVIHKLFKVLAPRFSEYKTCFTNLIEVPIRYNLIKDSKMNNTEKFLQYRRAVLELKGNPYPPMPDSHGQSRSVYLNNVLLNAAKKEYYWKKMSFNKE